MQQGPSHALPCRHIGSVLLPVSWSWLELPGWVLVSWLVLCYYSSSIGIIYFNAYILDDLFPHPATLTMYVPPPPSSLSPPPHHGAAIPSLSLAPHPLSLPHTLSICGHTPLIRFHMLTGTLVSALLIYGEQQHHHHDPVLHTG